MLTQIYVVIWCHNELIASYAEGIFEWTWWAPKVSFYGSSFLSVEIIHGKFCDRN